MDRRRRDFHLYDPEPTVCVPFPEVYLNPTAKPFQPTLESPLDVRSHVPRDPRQDMIMSTQERAAYHQKLVHASFTAGERERKAVAAAQDHMYHQAYYRNDRLHFSPHHVQTNPRHRLIHQYAQPIRVDASGYAPDPNLHYAGVYAEEQRRKFQEMIDMQLHLSPPEVRQKLAQQQGLHAIQLSNPFRVQQEQLQSKGRLTCQPKKYGYRSKQNKIDVVLKNLTQKYEALGKLANGVKLRGDDVVRVDVKRFNALQNIERLLEKIEIDPHFNVICVDFPISQKNRFQKKGFIAYIKCGSCDQAVRLKEMLSRYKDGKWRGKGDDRTRPSLFRVKIANDSFIRAKTMDLINEHIRNREIKAKMAVKRMEVQVRPQVSQPKLFPRHLEPRKGELLYSELEGCKGPSEPKFNGPTDEIDPLCFEDVLAMCSQSSLNSGRQERGVEPPLIESTIDEEPSSPHAPIQEDASFPKEGSSDGSHDHGRIPNKMTEVSSCTSELASSEEDDWDVPKQRLRLVGDLSDTFDSPKQEESFVFYMRKQETSC